MQKGNKCMVTLKELVNEQKLNEMSDIEVIKTFFALNNMEEEGMDFVYELSKSKIEKMKQKHRMAEEWVCNLPSSYLYETYDLETANKLHMLELNYLINGGKLSNNFLKWASENVPNITRPGVYFNPLIDFLRKNGIEFKNN